MLDISKKSTVSLPRTVDVYPDHASGNQFYAVPAEPRVALDADGRSRASLMVYQREEGPELEVVGGSVMLTVNLGLTPEERSALRERLAPCVERRRAREAGRAGGKPGRAGAEGVLLSSPEWTGGEVTVELGGDIRMRTVPSMVGDNECVLMLDLDPAQAQQLRRAWLAGLPDAVISYRVSVVAAGRSRTSWTSEGDPHALRGRSGPHRATFEYTTAGAYTCEMCMEGPPTLSKEDLRAGLTVVNL